MSDEIELFLIYLATERGLSTNYQLIVQRSLETFAEWASTRGLSWKGLEAGHITDFLVHRKRSGLQASSVRLDAVAIRIFFRFLVSRQGWPQNPAETLTLPRPEKHLPETLNPGDVRRLIESVGPGDPQGLRDRAMLELLYSSGLRVSELCNARLENLDLDSGFIRVTGKGNKTRMVPVGAPAIVAMNNYLESAEDRGGNFSLRPRKEADPAEDLAADQTIRGAGRARHQRLPAPVAAQLRNPPARRRGGSADHPGAARTRRYLDDPDLHPRRKKRTEGGAEKIPPARVARISQAIRGGARNHS